MCSPVVCVLKFNATVDSEGGVILFGGNWSLIETEEHQWGMKSAGGGGGVVGGNESPSSDS